MKICRTTANVTTLKKTKRILLFRNHAFSSSLFQENFKVHFLNKIYLFYLPKYTKAGYLYILYAQILYEMK